MSKETKTDEGKKKIFTLNNFKAVLLYIFIAGFLIQVGICVGWVLRSNDQCRIETQAAQLVESLKSQAK